MYLQGLAKAKKINVVEAYNIILPHDFWSKTILEVIILVGLFVGQVSIWWLMRTLIWWYFLALYVYQQKGLVESVMELNKSTELRWCCKHNLQHKTSQIKPKHYYSRAKVCVEHANQLQKHYTSLYNLSEFTLVVMVHTEFRHSLETTVQTY